MVNNRLTFKGKMVWLSMNIILSLTQIFIAYGLVALLAYPLLHNKFMLLHHPILSIACVLTYGAFAYVFSLLVEKWISLLLHQHFNQIASGNGCLRNV